MKTQNPSIVVLDGHCLNPGDLSWQGLEALGRCTVYERTPPEQLAERIREADIALTNKVPLRRESLTGQTRLKYIGVTATGYNIIDVDAAQEHGIVVTNVPTYGTMSVAQMVFAHLLNLTQRVGDHAQAVRQGRWASSPDWCFWDFPLLELGGMTMGIVGYGRIGQATAQLAQAFGMKVIAHNRSRIAASSRRSSGRFGNDLLRKRCGQFALSVNAGDRSTGEPGAACADEADGAFDQYKPRRFGRRGRSGGCPEQRAAGWCRARRIGRRATGGGQSAFHG